MGSVRFRAVFPLGVGGEVEEVEEEGSTLSRIQTRFEIRIGIN